jgi:hypothetical protein
MKSVQFIKPWKIYSRGDVAGFETKQADALIDGKVAEAYTAKAAEAKPAEADAKSAKADAK